MVSESDKMTVEDVSKILGLSLSDIDKFLSGEVVTKEIEASSSKDISLLVVGVMDASVEKCWQFIEEERLHEVETATVKYCVIEDVSQPSLDDMTLDDDALSKLNNNPSGLYFLSKAESQAIKDMVKKGTSALDALKSVLMKRIHSYWAEGIDGIVPYDGKDRSPKVDLEHANKAALELIIDPIFRSEIVVAPSKSSNPSMHSMSWSIQKGRDLATPTLNHHIRVKKTERFMSLTRRYYSGYDYDCTQILAGVLPTADGRSVVFYTNHTYTSKVSGLGGSVKRSVGRKIMVGKLVETMKKGQKAMAEMK